MTDIKYAFKDFEKDLMARASGRDLDISTKQAIEICSFLRNKKLQRAKQILKNVMEKKEAIPFKRFTDGLGHKRGNIAAGRFPFKASSRMLKLLESVEANAQSKGLNTSDLEIIHICANIAHRPMHHGRQSRRLFKRTHVEVVVKETAKKEKAAKGRKSASEAPKKSKSAPKAGEKPEVSQ
ncbi:TPA: 50S ribosomal protein L22 [Candidatus Woesearchaeota archaeon]|nr:50S ribosomal protein L22 [Candidatus Woesearchaeota archaeon]